MTGVAIVLPTLSVWHHYWKNKVVHVPEGSRFPRNKTLLSLWQSWHVPDFVKKVCPWRYLKCEDLDHIKRGKTKWNEMRLVINGLLHEVLKKRICKTDMRKDTIILLN